MKKIRWAACAACLFLAFAAFASAELNVDWSRAKKVADGISLVHFAIPSPLLQGDVMRIDLSTPGLSFRATEPDPKFGEPLPGYPGYKILTRTEYVRDFLSTLRTAKGENAVAAVNTAPWEPFPCSNRYAHVVGTCVSAGQVVREGGYPATFVRYRDGRVAITNRISVAHPEEIEVAASGFGLILDGQGRPTAKPSDKSRHPRTAFGLSADGRYLYWLTVDGRQPGYSVGASYWDMGEMLASLGCVSGMNMDGGGSTTLCYWDGASNAVVTASHAVSQDPKVARRVAFSIAAVIDPKATKEPTVDADIPAGNAIVESVKGGTVRLRQDMRDSADWFYWAFRVRGAAGRKLDFVFTDPYAGGPVSARGPAVTKDSGKTWSYAAEKSSRPNGFTYTFGPDENEVWFYQTIQYLPNDWEDFLARHRAAEGKTFTRSVLCKSRKGRAVPFARFGRLDGQAKYRLLLTSRHHCGEATATRVLEGACAAFFGADELGAWLRENVEATVVPFVDYDGVADGDQGKGRKPHDHNRDYTEFAYPETRAIRDWAAKQERVDMFIDFHCPWVRKGSNEYVNQVYGSDKTCTEQQVRFGKILERVQSGALDYRQADDVRWNTSWNTPANYTAGRSSTGWGRTALKGCRYSSSLEIPFSKAHDKVVDCASLRAFGTDVARAVRAYLE